MDGHNTYLVQWYAQEAQEDCIYSHEGSEIEKLGNGAEAMTRLSFSEEVRIGFSRLTVNSHWARVLGEEGRAPPSPKRRHKGVSGVIGDSPSCSQSQGDELELSGDKTRREVSPEREKRKEGGKMRRGGKKKKERHGPTWESEPKQRKWITSE